MKHLALGFVLLAGCAAPQLATLGGATTHRHGGQTWSIVDRGSSLAIVSVSGRVADPERAYRAAAVDFLLRSQRGCSLGNGGPAGDGRYVFDYACS
ncbi:MAG: hypothetical protein LPJ95_03350 [Paracoccaceae bacterium]|nr:hypothetical protein [Paracoccaceae bacterium]